MFVFRFIYGLAALFSLFASMLFFFFLDYCLLGFHPWEHFGFSLLPLSVKGHGSNCHFVHTYST